MQQLVSPQERACQQWPGLHPCQLSRGMWGGQEQLSVSAPGEVVGWEAGQGEEHPGGPGEVVGWEVAQLLLFLVVMLVAWPGGQIQRVGQVHTLVLGQEQQVLVAHKQGVAQHWSEGWMKDLQHSQEWRQIRCQAPA